MRLTLLACTLVFSFTARAADSLSTAQAHFKEAEAAVVAAGQASQRATEALRSCKRGGLQFQFGPSVERLEAARKSFESARRDAQAYRSGLEKTRKQIESTKGNAYAERLVRDYATPIETTLVPLLNGYASGITAWSNIFVKYGEFCAKPGYSTLSGAQFVTDIAPEIDALTKTAGEAVASASAAKSAIPVAVGQR